MKLNRFQEKVKNKIKNLSTKTDPEQESTEWSHHGLFADQSHESPVLQFQHRNNLLSVDTSQKPKNLSKCQSKDKIKIEVHTLRLS